jgi:hypothetical protein
VGGYFWVILGGDWVTGRVGDLSDWLSGRLGDWVTG